MTNRPRLVLFACVHNAGRSLMAEAFFNRAADPGKARARSGGTHPAASVHPAVLKAMRESGIDLKGAAPQALEVSHGADWLITMGCGEQCPVVAGARRDDWQIRDPKGQPINTVRHIRDDVRRRVASLIHQEGWSRTP